jgi:hypothetical protein
MSETSTGKASGPTATPARSTPQAEQAPPGPAAAKPPAEVGGPKGPEPTRFGDWERGGRCVDF